MVITLITYALGFFLSYGMQQKMQMEMGGERYVG